MLRALFSCASIGLTLAQINVSSPNGAESFTWSPSDSKWYFGAVFGIYLASANTAGGSQSSLNISLGTPGTVGMYSKGGKIYACNVNSLELFGVVPFTGAYSKVLEIDPTNSANNRVFDLIPSKPASANVSFCNDLVVTDTTVYATDAAAGCVRDRHLDWRCILV